MGESNSIIAEWKNISGMWKVETVGQLVEYATQLCLEYGPHAQYECFGHDMDEYVRIERQETEQEVDERPRLCMAKDELRKNRDMDTHSFWLIELGEQKYRRIINELNQE